MLISIYQLYLCLQRVCDLHFLMPPVTHGLPLSRNASYYSANVDGKPVKDIAWLVHLSHLRNPGRTNDLSPSGLRVYPDPTSKVEIKGRYAFDKVSLHRSYFDHLNLLFTP